MIKKEIIDRSIELGGTFDFNGQSLQSNIESIHFNKSYLEKEFQEYLQDEVLDRIKEEGVIYL
ncbi:hypothetical protein [Hathewaya limosa]|uniref:Uncharacterized protein n=1 Tax=Hathewaya limosa TaxID=1536 RepID=A0ABU0JX42_HATLI|nr:hypothetical protein [Hathewaya limosa]MDQ0480477.1 hypothetical protein [Hathewaya limosa]